MAGRMSHVSRASKVKCDGKERKKERTAQRQKRKGATNNCATEVNNSYLNTLTGLYKHSVNPVIQ